MWGEGINADNFEQFVWRGAAATAERLWATEESLGCPPDACPGISGARPGKSHWMRTGTGLSLPAGRLADQLCRMSREGLKPGPIAPSFCPSDAGNGAGTAVEAVNEAREARRRLESENAALKAQLADARRTCS